MQKEEKKDGNPENNSYSLPNAAGAAESGWYGWFKESVNLYAPNQVKKWVGGAEKHGMAGSVIKQTNEYAAKASTIAIEVAGVVILKTLEVTSVVAFAVAGGIEHLVTRTNDQESVLTPGSVHLESISLVQDAELGEHKELELGGKEAYIEEA